MKQLSRGQMQFKYSKNVQVMQGRAFFVNCKFFIGTLSILIFSRVDLAAVIVVVSPIDNQTSIFIAWKNIFAMDG